MYKTASLFEAVQMHIAKGVKIALLIIDEEPRAARGEKSNTPGRVFQYPEFLIGKRRIEVSDWLKSVGRKFVPESNVTTCQQRLLMYMQLTNCFVCSISFPLVFSLYETDNNEDLTRPALKGLYNGHEYRLQKPYYNAFRETNLHHYLQEHNITHLVVMGWHINKCIFATIGASWWPLSEGSNIESYHREYEHWDDVGDGATHLGYKVMTCNQILHGGRADWSVSTPAHYSYLEFYSRFGI